MKDSDTGERGNKRWVPWLPQHTALRVFRSWGRKGTQEQGNPADSLSWRDRTESPGVQGNQDPQNKITERRNFQKRKPEDCPWEFILVLIGVSERIELALSEGMRSNSSGHSHRNIKSACSHQPGWQNLQIYGALCKVHIRVLLP